MSGKQWSTIKPFKTIVNRDLDDKRYVYGDAAIVEKAISNEKWAEFATLLHTSRITIRIDLSPCFLHTDDEARTLVQEIFPRFRASRLHMKCTTMIWTNMRAWMQIVGRDGMMMMDEVEAPNIRKEPKMLRDQLVKNCKLEIVECR